MTNPQPGRLASLTPEQQSKIPAFRQEWLDIGLSCEPANREAAVEAVNDAYRQAGLEPPKVVIWMDSPFAGAVAAWMASEVGPALENFDLVKVFRDKMTAAFDQSVDGLAAPPTMYVVNHNLSLWHDVQPWRSRRTLLSALDSYRMLRVEIADRFNRFVRERFDRFDRLWQGPERRVVQQYETVHPGLIHTVFTHFPLSLSVPLEVVRGVLQDEIERTQNEDLVNRTWRQLRAQLIPQLRSSIAGPETASPLIPIRMSSLINQSTYADRLFVGTSDMGLVPWEMISTRHPLHEAVSEVSSLTAEKHFSIERTAGSKAMSDVLEVWETVREQLWPRPPYFFNMVDGIQDILPELVGSSVHFDMWSQADDTEYLRHMSGRWYSVMPDTVFLPEPIAVFDTIYSGLFAPVQSTLLDHRSAKLDRNLLTLAHSMHGGITASLFNGWASQITLVRSSVSDGIGFNRPVIRVIDNQVKRRKINGALDGFGFSRLLNSAGEFRSVTGVTWRLISEVTEFSMAMDPMSKIMDLRRNQVQGELGYVTPAVWNLFYGLDFAMNSNIRMLGTVASHTRTMSELIGSTAAPQIRATSAIQVGLSPQITWGVWNNTSPVFERDRSVNQIPGALLGAIDQAIRQSQLIDQTKEYVADVAMELILDHVAEYLNVQIKNGTAVSKIQRHVDHVIWGQHDYWLSFYDFFARVCDVESCKSLSGLINVAKNAGWWWPFEGAVIITDRPAAIHRDADSRLHNETGPAIEYRDGEGVFSWHGIRVPRALIEGNWTADDILKEPNAEIRRCAIEKMGWDWFVHSADLEPVGNPFRDPGNQGCWLTLYDVPRQLFQAPIRVLLCDNATLERDGTRRRFGLTVPADCKDPLQAAGWTFGLTREQYAKLRHAY